MSLSENNDNAPESGAVQAPLIKVEVAYATPAKQLILALEVSEGCSALEAAKQSGIASRFNGLDVENLPMGIFGKAVKPTHPLRAGDRVEIYRPLIADPKQARRDRADKAKSEKAKT